MTTMQLLEEATERMYDHGLPLTEARLIFDACYVQVALRKTRNKKGKVNKLRAAREIQIHRNTLMRIINDNRYLVAMKKPAHRERRQIARDQAKTA